MRDVSVAVGACFWDVSACGYALGNEIEEMR